MRDGGSFGTVKGYFETPDIADDLIDEDDDDADDETVENKAVRDIPCAGDTDRSSKREHALGDRVQSDGDKADGKRNEDRCGVS